MMQAFAVCSVKSSCESVFESFVSKNEIHFDSSIIMSEYGATEEFDVALTGLFVKKLYLHII